MAELTALLSVMKEAPGWATLVIVVVFVMFALYLQARKVNVSDMTSISSALSAQMTAQMEVSSKLNAQIVSLNEQLTEVYAQNKALREELLAATQKISELEDVLRQHKIPLAPADAIT